MRSLSAADIVQVWELGESSQVVDKGLLLLAAAHPDRPYRELARLSVGRRNTVLCALRERMFGPQLRARVECPTCGEKLEFSAALAELCRLDAEAPKEREHRLSIDEFEVWFRPPRVSDLAAAAAALGDVGEVRRTLLRDCVRRAERDGTMIAADDLPVAVVEAIEDELDDLDPNSDVVVGFGCAGCGHAWSAGFDIATFLWSEVAFLAQHLFDEVDLLARAYGWSEDTILAMSSTRRRRYLDRIAG
jgi:hypothetical protein